MRTKVRTTGLCDTDPAMLRIQRDILRRMTPAERLRTVCDLNRAADTLAIAGIRARFPGASEREGFLRLALRKLGSDLARRAYPELAEIEPPRG